MFHFEVAHSLVLLCVKLVCQSHLLEVDIFTFVLFEDFTISARLTVCTVCFVMRITRRVLRTVGLLFGICLVAVIRILLSAVCAKRVAGSSSHGVAKGGPRVTGAFAKQHKVKRAKHAHSKENSAEYDDK